MRNVWYPMSSAAPSPLKETQSNNQASKHAIREPATQVVLF